MCRVFTDDDGTPHVIAPARLRRAKNGAQGYLVNHDGRRQRTTCDCKSSPPVS
jgi:hypothetical protein